MERLQIAWQNKSAPWLIEDVTCVIKSLKAGKSQDSNDIPNELFKPDLAGGELAISKLMSRFKDELTYPTSLTVYIVTNHYKTKKQNKRLFDSYKEIFKHQCYEIS